MLNKAVTRTDIGNRKEVNQDSLYVAIANTQDGTMILSAVCDGMGGLSYGEIASSKTISAFKEWFQVKMPKIINQGFNWDIIEQQWEEIIYNTNNEIRKIGKEYNTNLGTTLSISLFYQNMYLIAQVGDSRCYEIGFDSIKQLTIDQTVVEREVRMGVLTKEQALHDSRKHVLLQGIGCNEDIDPMFTIGTIKENTNYVLCSDGFYKRLSQQDIQDYLGYHPSQTKDNIDIRVRKLIQECKNRGENDNISCIVLFE